MHSDKKKLREKGSIYCFFLPQILVHEVSENFTHSKPSLNLKVTVNLYTHLLYKESMQAINIKLQNYVRLLCLCVLH